MSPEIEMERCEELAPKLYNALLSLLEKAEIDAHVSYKIVEEVTIHFWRDIERLYATHHEQIHATKACSYLAFWVRKLKPISDALPIPIAERIDGSENFPHHAEINDVNEQISVHLAVQLARNCIRDSRIVVSDKLSIKEALKVFDNVTADYLTSEFEDGMSMGMRFESIVYDMRFRTFGPHHLTHMLTHMLREVFKECAK